MATVKIVLRKKQNKDESYPLALRITKDRKASYIHLGYSVLERDWDAKAQRVRRSHPNATRLNNFIIKKLAESTDTVLELDTQQKDISSDGIKRRLRPAADMMFFARADLFLQRLKDEGRYNSWHSRGTQIRVFKAFTLGTVAVCDEQPLRTTSLRHPPCQGMFNGTDVPFQKIDVGLLTQFKVYLKAQRGVNDCTVANYLVTIQSIFSQSIREGVLDRRFFPFGKDKIQIRVPESQKVGLTAAAVTKLEEAALSNPSYAEARDLWLLSFYFAGIRAGDVLQLRWRDFRDGRLHYVMNKNNKPVSLKVPEKARAILEHYERTREGPDGFVFSFLKGFEHVEDQFALKKRIA
ncbi:MAG: site-specific integrase, partial [Candidatus Kapaibacterium sp.]